jgi:hypothetical protein
MYSLKYTELVCVLYRYGRWSVTPRLPTISEKRMARRKSGACRVQVRARWRNLCTERFGDLHTATDIAGVTIYRRMQCTGQASCMRADGIIRRGEKCEKAEGKIPLTET